MHKSGVELRLFGWEAGRYHQIMADHLWPVWLDRISYYCLVNDNIFEKQKYI